MDNGDHGPLSGTGDVVDDLVAKRRAMKKGDVWESGWALEDPRFGRLEVPDSEIGDVLRNVLFVCHSARVAKSDPLSVGDLLEDVEYLAEWARYEPPNDEDGEDEDAEVQAVAEPEAGGGDGVGGGADADRGEA